jgi:flagellin-like protein
MTYNHTQHGRRQNVLFASSLVMLADGWLARGESAIVVTLLAVAVTFALFGLMFGSLTIRDEGQWLSLRFGLLPVFRKRIRYADITGVETARTSLFDGWGIHYFPGRGWTYNIFGRDCVKLTLGRKVIRVGTDDAENLAKVIRERTGLGGLSE